MTPLARLSVTLFTAFPVQRALLAVFAILSVVVAVVALGAGDPPFGTRWLYVGSVVATLFGAFVSFPTFMACGTLFAALSAPRTFLLLPHFRRRMLAAVLVVFAVGIAPVVALGYLMPQPGTVPAFLSLGFVFFTLLVLVTTLRPAMLALAPLALVSVLIVLGIADANAGTAVGPAVLVAASAVAWAAFARAYLRGKPIVARLPVLRDLLAGKRPPGEQLSGWQLWSTDTSADALTRNAFGVLLNGYLPARPWRQLAMLTVSFALAAFWVWFLFSIAPGLREAPLFLLPFVFVAPIGFVAARAMQGARRLWLLGPQRTVLFRRVERTAGRVLLALAGAAAALAFALAVWHEGLPLVSAALVAAALMAYAVLAAYIGLVFVRGFGSAALLAAVAFAGPYVYTLIRAAGAAEHGPDLAGSTAFALAAAGVCRYAALRRWREIDWIALRPPRSTSQRARAAGV